MLAVLKRGLIAAAITIAPLSAFAQSFPLKFDSAASPNATLVIIGKTQVRSLTLSNSTVTPQWLKIFDLAAQPNCGVSTPAQFKVMLPASTTIPLQIPDALQFQNGISFCLTLNQSDTDATNATTGLTVDFGVKQ